MSKVSCYVAAPWVHKDYAKSVRDQMVAAGIEVTSRWIDFEGDSTDPKVLEVEAGHDWEDITLADTFLLLNTQSRGNDSSGKAVETGIALASGKYVYMVGEPSNVFHWLEEVNRCGTVDDAIVAIKSHESIEPVSESYVRHSV